MIDARATQRAMACLFTMLAPACAMLFVAAPVAAAPPALPTDVFGREVIGILWIDAVALDAGKLEASVKNGFGKHGAVVNEWLKQYERAHASFVRAGGTSMAILYYDGSLGRDSANPIFMFSKSPNANEATIKGVLQGVSNDLAFDALGEWIVAYNKNQALPFFDRGSALRVQSFQSALKPIQSHAIVAAFVSNHRQMISNQRDEEELKSIRENNDSEGKVELGLAKDEATRQRIAKRLAMESIGHDAAKALNDIERIMHEAAALSITVTLGDKPVIQAELMLQDRAASADYLQAKSAAVSAFSKVIQQDALRGVPVRMINRMSAQHAVLASATIEADGPTVRGSAQGASLVKMIEDIGAGINRSLAEAQVVLSMNKMKALAIALTNYANDNGGQFPAKLDSLNEFSYVRNLKELIENPRGEGYGYVYLRPADKLADLFKNNKLATTPIIMETRNGQIDPTGLVVYISGKVFRPEK